MPAEQPNDRVRWAGRLRVRLRRIGRYRLARRGGRAGSGLAVAIQLHGIRAISGRCTLDLVAACQGLRRGRGGGDGDANEEGSVCVHVLHDFVVVDRKALRRVAVSMEQTQGLDADLELFGHCEGPTTAATT